MPKKNLICLPLLAVAAISLAAGGRQDPSPEAVALTSLRPVSSEAAYVLERREFAMGGVAYTRGIVAGEREKGATVTYAIPPKSVRFLFEVGVNDRANLKGSPTFAVYLDGDLAAGGDVGGDLSKGMKPVKLDLDVRGKRSIQFRLAYGAGIGEGRFEIERKAPVAKVESRESKAGVPDLVAPAEKAVVSGERVNLRWSAVPGAVSYGVSVVSFRSDASLDGDAARIWAVTTNTNSASFDLSKLPKGEYLWSVIAFGAKRPLGGYSAERVFVRD